MPNSLPSITSRQQEIVELIYRYRFLDRTQIQTLLNHKDKKRILAWLKGLREKEYLSWRYDATHFVTKCQPAVYYLSLNGIRYLHNLNKSQIVELRKRYKDSNRTQAFISRNLLIADFCIALITKSDNKVQYFFSLPVDYMNPSNSISFLEDLKPHLYLSRHRDGSTINYLLEKFEQNSPRYQLRKRLKDYISFLNNTDNPDSLIALLICASTSDLLYVKRSVKKLLEDSDEQMLHIRVTTLDKIKLTGLFSKIWEEIKP